MPVTVSFSLFAGPGSAAYVAACCAWLRFWAADTTALRPAGFIGHLSGFAGQEAADVVAALRAAVPAGQRPSLALVRYELRGPAFRGRRWVCAALRFASLWDGPPGHTVVVMDVHDHLPTQRREAAALVARVGTAGGNGFGATFWRAEGAAADCAMPARVILPAPGHRHIDGGLLVLAPGATREALRRVRPSFTDFVRGALAGLAAGAGCGKGVDEALLEAWLYQSAAGRAAVAGATIARHRSFLAAPPVAKGGRAGLTVPGAVRTVVLEYGARPPTGAVYATCRERRPRRAAATRPRTSSPGSDTTARGARRRRQSSPAPRRSGR